MATKKGPVEGHAEGNRGGKHHEGWNEALEGARKQADDGEHAVELQVTVSSNPGHITEYRVRLTPL